MRLLPMFFTVVAIGLLAAVAYLNLSAADVLVTNTGATTVRLRGAMPDGVASVLAAAGVRDLPDELAPGVPALVKVPRLNGLVDASAASITISLLGQSAQFQAACDRLELDGASLLNRQTAVDLASQGRHDLRFACR